MTRILIRTSETLDDAARLAASLFLGLMVMLIGIQVIARYIFADPPAWTEEGARYAMVWAGLLGATIAFRAASDPVLVRPAIVTEGRLRFAGLAGRSLAVVLFLAPILYFCIFGPGLDPGRGFLARSAARQAESLGVSMVWFTAALPLSIAIILIHVLASLARRGAPAPQKDENHET
ncbi:MAG: TRAP transporter small permease subunit [Alphaproteobacteria bacterium]|nr:TRAP transporter small permease subunit [Alphaproteobacteria bacterium]